MINLSYSQKKYISIIILSWLIIISIYPNMHNYQIAGFNIRYIFAVLSVLIVYYIYTDDL